MNVYDQVTERITAQLEKGVVPWRKEWKTSGFSSLPFNHTTQKPYRGINVLLLLCSGFGDSRWLTYRQAQEIGAQVRKGEKGTHIVFWSKFDVERIDAATGAAEERSVPFLRQYTVFNVEQIDGITAELPFDNTFEPIPAAQALADSYLTRAGIELRHGGERAYYHPRLDYVAMPNHERFELPEAYYSTLFHELGHSTGHASRLDRKFDAGATFGSCDYSREELVAEFTAAFLCAAVGVSNERVELNHAAYIDGWLKALRDDKKLLVMAAQKAQRAADLVQGKVFDAVAEVPAIEAVAA